MPLEMGSSLHRDTDREPGRGGFVYRKVRETHEEGLWIRTVSLYGSEGILEGGTLYWEL